MNTDFKTNIKPRDILRQSLDINFFLDVITRKSNTYYFYGDKQKNIFYLSDNMVQDFGFESNYVSDFALKWDNRVYSDQERVQFHDAIQEMYNLKLEEIDLRYRVCDVKHNVIWIHFYGGVKYNSGGQPLKFVGYLTKQDDYLLVDPLSGFPKEKYFVEYMHELEEKNHKVIGIGIHLKHLAEMNSRYGRAFTDDLIKKISMQFNQILSKRLKFFRMDGPVVIALLDASQADNLDNQIYMIRTIIKNVYSEKKINVIDSSKIVALQNDMSVSLFIEDIFALLKMSRTMSTDKTYLNGNLGMNRLIKEDEFKVRSSQILQIHQDVICDMINFRVVFQPIVDAKTERIAGGETLLRWQYKGKDISPGIFVELLEKQNLIQKVGRWVFEQAVQTCKTITAFNPDFYLSVNVSLLQMKDEGFIDFIKDTLYRYQLPSKNIVIEMTESTFDNVSNRVETFVSACKIMGIRLALDDFGTGYSSIANLFRYETQIIKIDRSLLLEMEVNEERRKFISSIIRTFKMTGRRVVVEGVETEHQKQILEDTGCDYIQGFYYFKPLEKRELRSVFYKNI